MPPSAAMIHPVTLPGSVAAAGVLVLQQVRGDDPLEVVEHELLLVDTAPGILEMGMCGGPCLAAADSAAAGGGGEGSALSGGALVGMLEGKLPQSSEFAELGAVIPRHVLLEMVA